jgi:hypothetical protein
MIYEDSKVSVEGRPRTISEGHVAEPAPGAGSEYGTDSYSEFKSDKNKDIVSKPSSNEELEIDVPEITFNTKRLDNTKPI